MRLLTLILMCGVASAGAADKPVAYNPTSGELGEADRLAHDGLAARYTIIDVDRERSQWTFPKGISAFGPPPPVYLKNKCIPGNVLVIYVVSSDGEPKDAFAPQATNDLLAGVAVHLLSERRFAPAQISGRPVPSVAATRFNFRCPH